jgi:primosomal protein N' (replication factor Y)
MHYYEVAPNKIARTGADVFTYASPETLSIGHIVEIEIGKKNTLGIIVEQVNKPRFLTKEIIRVIEPRAIPKPLIETARWMSNYYVTPLATTLQTILPRGLQKARRERQQAVHTPIRERTQILLSNEQSVAVNTLTAMPPGTAILHGVTGSGKTQVYIELAKQMLRKGKSTIVLVPEIALTSQVVDEFRHYFKNVILTHSGQSEAERHLIWLSVLHSNQPQVIIGPRSALFLPTKDVGMIVVDEAHEPSFKQEQAPRYSALRVASILASYHQAKTILGSATPLITDYYLAKHSKRPIVSINSQARPNTVKPTITTIDMTKKSYFKRHRFFSDALLEAIDATIQSPRQVLLFHNRRGSASTTLCQHCGWIALCSHCFIPFTLHADKHTLQCHVCNMTQKVPTHCPVCHKTDIIFKGIGTKLIESELKKLYPNKKVARFDADTSKAQALNTRYKDLYDGSVQFIIGTQTITKGLDLPHLRTVGIIQADAGLLLPDYSSSERTFQLLAQVVGRVGRSHHPTNVIIQSYQPRHSAIIDGLSQNYQNFYKTTLAIRKAGNFPPFTYLLKLICLYKTEATAIKNASKLAHTLKDSLPSTIQVLGPTPAFYERQGNIYRWQLVLKSPKRSDLIHALALIPPAHWQFELDPVTLL